MNPGEAERFGVRPVAQAIGAARRDPDFGAGLADAAGFGEALDENALPLGGPAVVAMLDRHWIKVLRRPAPLDRLGKRGRGRSGDDAHRRQLLVGQAGERRDLLKDRVFVLAAGEATGDGIVDLLL